MPIYKTHDAGCTTMYVQNALFELLGNENRMARSARNDGTGSWHGKGGPRDPAVRAARAEDSVVESEPAPDSLNLGHAGLSDECWSGTCRMGSGRCGGVSAVPPRQPHTPSNRSRPSQQAEAHFTPENREFLTY